MTEQQPTKKPLTPKEIADRAIKESDGFDFLGLHHAADYLRKQGR